MKKKAWRLEYPSKFESKQKHISELEESIKIKEALLNEKSQKMLRGGAFKDPNDPKVIEMMNLLDEGDFHNQIAELHIKINQIKSQIYESD